MELRFGEIGVEFGHGGHYGEEVVGFKRQLGVTGDGNEIGLGAQGTDQDGLWRDIHQP